MTEEFEIIDETNDATATLEVEFFDLDSEEWVVECECCGATVKYSVVAADDLQHRPWCSVLDETDDAQLALEERS